MSWRVGIVGSVESSVERWLRDLPEAAPELVIEAMACRREALARLDAGGVDCVVIAASSRTGPSGGQAASGAPSIALANAAEAGGRGGRGELVPSPAAREVFRRIGLVGESSALLRSLALVERAARSGAAVCIEGETGTGKELAARAVHDLSDRKGRSFLAQNCAALTDGLLDSELFGHVRGAFTGASAGRRGLFELAAGGTLFLDEVSETALPTQAKLLRVLQEGEVRALGSERTRRVDVRIVVASNRDLREEVAAGRFRADLYHRLSILPVRLPPLRERSGDIPLLARHFAVELSRSRGPRRLMPRTLDALEGYAWPGNVRELRNEIERLLIYDEGTGPIAPTSLAAHIRDPGGIEAGSRPRALREIVREVEAATILARLRDHGYCRTTTARSLGITREALWSKMRQLGCSVPPRRSAPGP
jgi:Nif-specific regulatory protein